MVTATVAEGLSPFGLERPSWRGYFPDEEEADDSESFAHS